MAGSWPEICLDEVELDIGIFLRSANESLCRNGSIGHFVESHAKKNLREPDFLSPTERVLDRSHGDMSMLLRQESHRQCKVCHNELIRVIRKK